MKAIREFWIINRAKQQVEVYRQPENPTGGGSAWQYASVTACHSGERVSPLRKPDVSFGVDQLLA